MIDKIYLNLQEQVDKNKKDIELLNQFQIAVSAFGFKPRGIFSIRPDIADYDVNDAVFVGSNPPYAVYAKIEGKSTWAYFGTFPRAGAQGGPGPAGEPGEQGVRGPKVYLKTSAPQPLEVVDEGQLEGDFCLLINGEVYTYIEDTGFLQWIYFTQIRGAQGIPGRKGDTGFSGPQGDTGPQGPQGDPGAFIHIGGVKSSVGQLPGWGGLTPMPSDPSIAYFVGDNPEIYLNDLYIQVGETREDREWLNIGTINIATYVTVNGQFVGSWDADTKLDKNTTPTTNWQCYVKRQDGSQTMIDVGDPRNAYCIAQSDQYGRLQSNHPASGNDVVTKSHADLTYNMKGAANDASYVYSHESDARIYMDNNMSFTDQNGSVYLYQLMALVGCVLEGTKITMADGTKKAVEDIKPGDEVLGYDFETGETVPTVVVMNLHEKPSRATRMNLFSDGTILSTVGEHHIFEVDGDPCRDVNDLKTDSKVMKENGDIVTFNGYYNRTDALFESYNLLTSNNTYFAEGLMNSCFPPAKFNHLKERHIDMPTQLFNEVETELDYSRDGAYRLNNPDFIREVIELTKNKRSIYETIKSDKKELADSDWSTIKLCEQVLEALKGAQSFDEYKTSVITLLEEKASKTLEKRAQRRAQINAIENAEKEYNDQIKALKVKYNILTDFDELSLIDQFKECNKLGNANYNLYKFWLQK